MTAVSVLLLDTEPSTQNHYIVLAIADALRRDFRVANVVVASHRDAISLSVARNIDLFIAFGGARPHTPLLTRVAALARRSVLWTTEDPYELRHNVKLSTAFDVIFTNDRSCVSAYKKPAYHLPLAASPLFQNTQVIKNDCHYRYDLLFIGTAWPNRVATINRIIDSLPKTARFKLALPWNEYIGRPKLKRSDLVTDWRCSNMDFARLANVSRVVLTLPRHFSAADAAQVSGTTPPPRLFETALAGGYQIVVGADAEVLEYYDHGSELHTCDEADAVGAVIGALSAPEQRIRAAQAARVRTQQAHLYDHRIAHLLDITLASKLTTSRSVHSAHMVRRTILCVSHNRRGFQSGGGVEIYLEQILKLGPNYEILFLFPNFNGESWNLRLQGRAVDLEIDWGYNAGPTLTDSRAEGVFERVLFEYKIDLVHFHHLLHLPLSLPLIARSCGVPVIYHLHDHFLICERWLLLDQHARFCDVVNRGRDQCDACMIAGSNYPRGSKARRDSFMSLVIDCIDVFITSTPSTGGYLRKFFPQIQDTQIAEIEMINVSESTLGSKGMGQSDNNTVKSLIVAIPNGLSQHKGGDDIIEIMRLCEGYQIQFKIFGRVEPHYAGRLSGLPGDLVQINGSYEQSAIIALLRGCDVSLHLSTWPETYVLALTEAWQAGLVPIVTDIGALRERVKDGCDGYVVRPHHPGGVFTRLIELTLNPLQLSMMREAVAKKTFPTANEHLSKLQNLYDRLIKARPCPHDRVPDRLAGPFDLKLAHLGLRVNAARWFTSEVEWDRKDESGPDTSLMYKEVSLQSQLDVDDKALSYSTIQLTDPRTTWALDDLIIDGKRITTRSGAEVVSQDFALKGWLQHPAMSTPQQIYLRFVGPSGVRFAKLENQTRPDLNINSGRSVDGLGFRGRVTIFDLKSGSYRVDLLQIANNQAIYAEGMLQFFMAGSGDFGKRSIWQPQSEKTLPSTSCSLHVQRQNLTEIDGVVMAAANSEWALSAILPNQRAVSHVVLCPDVGSTCYTLTPLTTSDVDGDRPMQIGFVASLSGIEPDLYSLSLREDGPEAGEYVDTGVRLHVNAGPNPFRFVKEAPDALRQLWRLRMVFRSPVIEQVDALAPTLGYGSGMIRCRGWAFVRGIGAPRSVVVRWEEEGEVRYCISAAVPRPEIAARRGHPDALSCGFTVVFPAASLRRGLRFYQVYERRTVAYKNFRTTILRRWTASNGSLDLEPV